MPAPMSAHGTTVCPIGHVRYQCRCIGCDKIRVQHGPCKQCEADKAHDAALDTEGATVKPWIHHPNYQLHWVNQETTPECCIRNFMTARVGTSDRIVCFVCNHEMLPESDEGVGYRWMRYALEDPATVNEDGNGNLPDPEKVERGAIRYPVPSYVVMRECFCERLADDEPCDFCVMYPPEPEPPRYSVTVTTDGETLHMNGLLAEHAVEFVRHAVRHAVTDAVAERNALRSSVAGALRRWRTGQNIKTDSGYRYLAAQSAMEYLAHATEDQPDIELPKSAREHDEALKRQNRAEQS